MSSLPRQFLLLTIAGWMTRDHQRVTEYLLAENTVLREQLRGRRLRDTDSQRRRLATAAKKLGRKALNQLGTLVTPDSLMRWYRRLVAAKYDSSARRHNGQPRRSADIVALVLRMAKDNSTWGYTRIRGALFNLGHEIGRNTIKRILIEAGIDPAPERSKRTSWERWIGSARRECLAKVIPLGERHLHKLVSEFVAHYQAERNHQSLGNNLIVPRNETAANSGRVIRRQRPGGVLNYYHREAA